MDKVDVKTLLAGVVIKKDGKVVTQPVSGHHQAFPVKGSPLAVIAGQEVVKALKDAFPRATFTWFAKPQAEVAKAGESDKVAK